MFSWLSTKYKAFVLALFYLFICYSLKPVVSNDVYMTLNYFRHFWPCNPFAFFGWRNPQVACDLEAFLPLRAATLALHHPRSPNTCVCTPHPPGFVSAFALLLCSESSSSYAMDNFFNIWEAPVFESSKKLYICHFQIIHLQSDDFSSHLKMSYVRGLKSGWAHGLKIVIIQEDLLWKIETSLSRLLLKVPVFKFSSSRENHLHFFLFSCGVAFTKEWVSIERFWGWLRWRYKHQVGIWWNVCDCDEFRLFY